MPRTGYHQHQLGEERAEAVRLFMNQHGVPLNRMATILLWQAGSGGQQTRPAWRAENAASLWSDGVTQIGAAPANAGRPQFVFASQCKPKGNQRQSPAPMAKACGAVASDSSNRPCIC